MKKTLLTIVTSLTIFNLCATVYTFDLTPTVTKTSAPYAAGDVFSNGSEICLNATTSSTEDAWFPIFANPSNDGLSYSYKDNESNIQNGKKAIVYKASEQAIVLDGSKRKMKISGLNVGDKIYMNIGSKGGTAHTFSVTGATAEASNAALTPKDGNYSYVDWYYTATEKEVIFEVSAGGCIIKTIKTGSDVLAGLGSPLSDKGIFFNGHEIVNEQHLPIEVYDVLGKRVAASNNNIALNDLKEGIYMVRATGVKGTIKFSK